jgi:hypothetical protein
VSFDVDKLAGLLPAIYRIRDTGQDGALRALLSAIASEIAVLEEDLAQLYDDQFIETCAEWVVPYIGDLIGYRAVYGLTASPLSPRAEVANTISFRRRKGAAAMLEDLARDVTGWDARVVEMFAQLATTQYLNHVRPENLAIANVRNAQSLTQISGPFDSVTRTADVRNIASGRGRYNIPNVAIFLWRLRAVPLTNSPALRVDDRRYLFNPLGSNTQLFTRSVHDDDFATRVAPTQVPEPINRRALDRDLQLPLNQQVYFGPGKSLNISGVTADKLHVCDLSDVGQGWAHTAPAGTVAIDPALGRIAFGDVPASPPLVSYHCAMSASLGGGEYDREDSIDPLLQPVQKVPVPQAKIQPALDAVNKGGAVEISDSGHYTETPKIGALAAARVELRAADGTRPTLTLAAELVITGENAAEVTLSGLVISGGTLHVVETAGHARLQRLRLVHCTLVPGLALAPNGSPLQPAAPSLIVETPDTVVEIDHCIVGALRITNAAQVQITGSIVDATTDTGVAYSGLDGKGAGAALKIENCTVIGKVHTAALEHASNTIFFARQLPDDGFTGPVVSDRRQEGCVRFSYVPVGSRVPRRYQCQPARDSDALQVMPVFTSTRYGDPGYCQLSERSSIEITQGADDQAEMGVLHDLLQAQRETNLRVRLNEYLRFGLEAGIVYAS